MRASLKEDAAGAGRILLTRLLPGR